MLQADAKGRAAPPETAAARRPLAAVAALAVAVHAASVAEGAEAKLEDALALGRDLGKRGQMQFSLDNGCKLGL